MANNSSRQSMSESQVKIALWATGIVVVAMLSLLIVKGISSSRKDGAKTVGSTPASAELIAKVTSVAQSTFDIVGSGSAGSLPVKLDAPALTKDGKPHVLYIGAEYCPYCATQRWPMVVALSRFGTFSNLGITHSASADVYPDTATFSFHGASYSSQYLSFDGVETLSNEPQGSSYKPLDTLTSEQQDILTKYDAAPYVPAQSAGAIPFVDFGGKYMVSGSSYQPDILQGKRADAIASAFTDPSNSITQGIIGSANVVTATLCTLTGDQPSTVCAAPVIQGLKAKLPTK